MNSKSITLDGAGVLGAGVGDDVIVGTEVGAGVRSRINVGASVGNAEFVGRCVGSALIGRVDDGRVVGALVISLDE